MLLNKWFGKTQNRLQDTNNDITISHVPAPGGCRTIYRALLGNFAESNNFLQPGRYWLSKFQNENTSSLLIFEFPAIIEPVRK